MWKEVKKISYHLDEIDALHSKKGTGMIVFFKDDEGNKKIETKVHNSLHQFNITSIDEEWTDWFAEVWARQIKRNIEYGMKLAREEINTHIDDLFHTLQRRT